MMPTHTPRKLHRTTSQTLRKASLIPSRSRPASGAGSRSTPTLASAIPNADGTPKSASVATVSGTPSNR